MGKTVPVRTIGEQHVKDDLGWVPSVKDWLQHLQLQPWMGRTPFRPQLEANENAELSTAGTSRDQIQDGAPAFEAPGGGL
jgi:hypothetical protein